MPISSTRKGDNELAVLLKNNGSQLKFEINSGFVAEVKSVDPPNAKVQPMALDKKGQKQALIQSAFVGTSFNKNAGKVDLSAGDLVFCAVIDHDMTFFSRTKHFFNQMRSGYHSIENSIIICKIASKDDF